MGGGGGGQDFDGYDTDKNFTTKCDIKTKLNFSLELRRRGFCRFNIMN